MVAGLTLRNPDGDRWYNILSGTLVMRYSTIGIGSGGAIC
jgi:hypothetical protein